MTKILVVLVLLIPQLQIQEAKAGVPIPENIANLGLLFVENSEIGRMPSNIIGVGTPNVQKTFFICNGLDDPYCINSQELGGLSNFDVCREKMVGACIQDAWATDAQGKKIPGEFIKSVPEDSRYFYDENADMKLPRSRGIGGVWRFPGVLNSAGLDTYIVSAQGTFWGKKSSGQLVTKTILEFGEIAAAIIPTEETKGNFELLTASDARSNPNALAPGSNWPRKGPDGLTCIANGTSYCMSPRQFPNNYRFGLSLRLPQKSRGWFHGRFFQPQISLKEGAKTDTLNIEAEPVKVSALDFTVPNALIPDKIRKLIATGRDFGVSGTSVGFEPAIKMVDNLAGPDAMQVLSDFSPAYKDTATRTDTYWSFKTLNFSGFDGIENCSNLQNSIAGLVTTNALTYSAGPPQYNSVTGTLEYKVASPHFEANGEIASGTYDLAIRSDVARCIYNFSNAPIKAEVSVTGDTGEKRVATTVVNEKDGWLYMSAKGFTFSAPTIQVKLSQDVQAKTDTNKVTADAVGKTSSKVTTSKKTISITCVKGQINKKITGTSPKCPSGFRKK